MVVKYAPLVLKMVHRIAPIVHAVVDFDDLKSVGYIALVQPLGHSTPNLELLSRCIASTAFEERFWMN